MSCSAELSLNFSQPRGVGIARIYQSFMLIVPQVTCSFTFVPAPSLYPIEVYVYSHTAESVIITWRGVSTKAEEESLEGYKVS